MKTTTNNYAKQAVQSGLYQMSKLTPNQLYISNIMKREITNATAQTQKKKKKKNAGFFCIRG